MKLSYRDRIILVVALVILILGVGIFALIKPTATKIKENKETRDKTQASWDAIEVEINKIPGLKKKITDRYDEALKIANYFTPLRDSYEMDLFAQENLDLYDMKLVDGLTVSDPTITGLEYYYYEPKLLTSDMQTNADLDGSIAAAATEAMKESQELSSRTVQSVFGNTLNLTVNTTKENLMTFLAEIKNMDTSIIVSSIKIQDLDFHENPEPGEEVTADQIGRSDVTLTVDFYSVPIPTKPDLGK